jgi:hypothetical protein
MGKMQPDIFPVFRTNHTMATKRKENKENETHATPAGIAAITTPFLLAGTEFDDTEGETFAGLNLLRLKQGEAAGPFVLKEILKNQKLGGDGAKRKPVDVYVATNKGTEIRMPVAAAFIKKAVAAKLKAGDTFLVKRLEDYIAKKFGKQGCADYALKVTARAE